MSDANIILIGFMGSGKSTVGRRVAKRAGYDFLDTDHQIEADMNMKVSEIFAAHGEAYFRELESRLAASLVHKTRTVVATGGGLPVLNQETLKSAGKIIWLKSTLPEILKRVRHDGSRPLLTDSQNEEKRHTLFTERESIYKSLAQFVVLTDSRPMMAIVSTILRYIQSH